VTLAKTPVRASTSKTVGQKSVLAMSCALISHRQYPGEIRSSYISNISPHTAAANTASQGKRERNSRRKIIAAPNMVPSPTWTWRASFESPVNETRNSLTVWVVEECSMRFQLYHNSCLGPRTEDHAAAYRGQASLSSLCLYPSLCLIARFCVTRRGMQSERQKRNGRGLCRCRESRLLRSV